MDQKTLIDKACDFAHGESALARLLGVSAGNVNDWHHNRRACPVKHVAAMATLIGAEDVARVVGQVELARAGNPESEARRGVRRGAVATLRGWVAVLAAALIAAPGSERQVELALATEHDV